MKRKVLSIAVFSLSFLSLIISLKLFWNMGIFVDEYGLSPSAVNGGDFWLLMDWLRLLLLFLLCIIFGVNLFNDDKK
ncbi:hypothetical protein [Paenibacillus woosongensis]|uniref:Uncharacterized protein n=1 Tax=Paenibacillus woosongensis TaxID=307580 RepID=A0ABQ4ML52_9BACL|nr:hypothetical protein [Paenibacillus woosongensis]GIP56716.1 hypothetical protein J15TS10_05300 [Paenibacillus woosongensis]